MTFVKKIYVQKISFMPPIFSNLGFKRTKSSIKFILETFIYFISKGDIYVKIYSSFEQAVAFAF